MTTPTPENPGQQAPAPAQQSMEGYVEKARFDGLVRKVEELTLANRELMNQLASKSSEIEQLKTQLGIKDTEKAAAVAERDAQVQKYVQEKSALESENSELRALKLKLDVAKEIGRPDLLKIADTIPNMSDPAALKAVMSSIAELVDGAVAEREKQLLAGVTPKIENNQSSPTLPSSRKDWDRYLSSLTLGSPEREKAMDQYYNWLEANAKK